MTLACTILGARAGRPVASGETVEVAPDVVLSHEDTAAIAQRLESSGGARVCEPDLHVIVLDRCASAGGGCAGEQRNTRVFAERHGIENFHDVNAGLGHQVLLEQGHVLPGRLIVGSNARLAACGALGACAIDVGPDGVAAAMATGRVRLRVPATARVIVRGRCAAGVTPYDLALRLLEDLGPDGGRGLAFEFTGPGLAAISMTGRLTLCGLLAVSGAAAACVEPDAVTLAWLNGRARGNFEPARGDPAAPVVRELTCDAGALTPLVARVDGSDVLPLSRLGVRPVDQVTIGGCSGGRLDDLRAAAAVLRHRRVAPGTRLLVLPASPEVLRACALDGTLVTLLDAGAVLIGPGGGVCGGRHEQLLAPAETGVATSACPGGSAPAVNDTATWLASPPTCAATAVAGRLVDAREVAGEDALRDLEISA
ncbi:MAG: aconitase family protein [Candidatus Krumholzibacteriia bacterium]